MSWKDAFAYTKSVAANHGIDSAKKELRADDGLPFGARVGGLLKLQMSPIIRASASGSLISSPTVADSVIVAISSVKLNLSGKIHRLYLSLGDNDDGQERFLQIFTNEQGKMVEALYCATLVRIIPESEEEQDSFTGESGAGLGELNYSLWKGQIEGLGINGLDLKTVFGDSDSVDYVRDVGNPSINFIPPLHGSEVRVDDANGEHGLEQEIYFMPYVRSYGGDESNK